MDQRDGPITNKRALYIYQCIIHFTDITIRCGFKNTFVLLSISILYNNGAVEWNVSQINSDFSFI